MEFRRRTIRRDRLNAFAVRRIDERSRGSRFGKNIAEKIKTIRGSMPGFRLFTPRNTIILSAIIAIFLTFTAVNVLRGMHLRNAVFFFGKDLAADEYGHTNILLLGAGGGNHDGADLTDTIMIASINQKTNEVTMLSIPRDLYVTDESIKPVQGTDSTRINNLYHIGKNELHDEPLGLTMLRNKIHDVTNIDIHYFIKVEFQGFKEIVDALDGIDVDVPEAVYDPEYPRGENIGYETFSISPGLQHLDGETALKYARSRKTTNDFSRSKRQQLIIYALKEKAEKLGILGDSGKISSIYDSLSKYIETDLQLRELITLAKIGTQVNKDLIASYSIHDDPTKCGGLLYTPARELYGGASVLIAATKGDGDIHNMSDIVMNHPEFRQQNIKVQILNGTKALGLAAESKILLNRLCLNVVRFGNAQGKDVATTMYYLKSTVPDGALQALQKLIPGTVSTIVPQKYLDIPYASDAQIVIELGADYLPQKMKDPYDGLVDLIPKAKTVSGEAESTTTTAVKTVAPAPTPKKK